MSGQVRIAGWVPVDGRTKDASMTPSGVVMRTVSSTSEPLAPAPAPVAQAPSAPSAPIAANSRRLRDQSCRPERLHWARLSRSHIARLPLVFERRP